MRHRSRAIVAHDLETAERFAASYAGRPPATNPYVERMRIDNDLEIAALRTELADLQPPDTTDPIGNVNRRPVASRAGAGVDAEGDAGPARRTILWLASPKGGTGTTTVAALAALAAVDPDGTLVVDLAGDFVAVLGPDRPGSSTPRLIDLSAVGRPQLRDHVTSTTRLVIVDAGHRDPDLDVTADIDARVRHYQVLRPCYLGLRRAVERRIRPHGIVLVDDPGRAVTADVIARTLDRPIVATFPWEPRLTVMTAGALLPSYARHTPPAAVADLLAHAIGPPVAPPTIADPDVPPAPEIPGR